MTPSFLPSRHWQTLAQVGTRYPVWPSSRCPYGAAAASPVQENAGASLTGLVLHASCATLHCCPCAHGCVCVGLCAYVCEGERGSAIRLCGAYECVCLCMCLFTFVYCMCVYYYSE